MALSAAGFQRFFRELKRRHVFKVGAVYLGTTFVLLQAARLVFPSLSIPNWTFDLLVIMVLFGFPITVIVAWAFEITPEGVKRTPPPLTLEESLSEESTDGLVRKLASLVGRDAGEGEGTARPPGPEAKAEGAPADAEDLRRASLAKLRHDLRSPINAIVGYAEMLVEEEEERPEPDAETVEDLDRIRQAGLQLQRAVDELLQPERGSAGTHPGGGKDTQELEQELHHRLRTPLNAVVGYSELLRERHGEMGREDLRDDLGRILKAARDMLERSEEIIRFCTARSAGEATPADFERVSGIARQALSRIRTVGPVDAAGGNGHAGALLVVDDEEANRDLFSRRLALQGYTVSVASDGREALERLRSQEFDLVLLDLLMPGMEGTEVLARMQADADLAVIPVIVVSGLDAMDVAVRCLRSGAVDFVTKPFDPALLAVRVEVAIRTRRLRDEARRNRLRVSVQDQLLRRVLFAGFPEQIAERIRGGETEFVDHYPEASVLSACLVGLPGHLSRGDPVEGLRAVAGIRRWVEATGREHGIEVMTFRNFHLLAAAGLPTPREDHARAVAEFGLALLNPPGQGDGAGGKGGGFRFRMGAHVGPVTAGVGGSDGLLAYELWGEAVELADGLEASGPLDALHVSSAFRTRLGEDRPAESRGVVEVEGQGRMRTFTLRPVAAVTG